MGMTDDFMKVIEHHVKEGRTAEEIAEIEKYPDVSYIEHLIGECGLPKDDDTDSKIRKGIEILKKAKSDTTSYFGQQYYVSIHKAEPISPFLKIPRENVYGDTVFDYLDEDLALMVVCYPNKVEYGRSQTGGQKGASGRLVPKWRGISDVELFPYVLYCDRLGNKGFVRLDQKHDIFQYGFIDTTKTIPIPKEDKRLAEIGNIKKDHPRIQKKIMIPKDIYNKNSADLKTAPLIAYTFHESHRITSKDIFNDFRKKIDYSIDTEEWVKSLLAYWSIGTYFFEIFRAYPYLWCYALRGSGKTRVLNTLASLSKNGMYSSNTTLSAMVRNANAYHGTLALDQLEKLAKKKEYAEFISALCSGYKRGSTYQYSEFVNKRWTGMALNIYCPKVLASTEDLDPTLLSRAIPIPIKRSMQSSKYEPRELDRMELRPLRNRAIVFSIMNGPKLCHEYKQGNFTLFDDLLPETRPRVREILGPILALAEFLDVDDIERGYIKEISKHVSEYAKSESVGDMEARILCGCYHLVTKEGKINSEYKIKEITDALDLRTDAEIDYYNSRRVGRKLKVLGFKSRKLGGYPYYKLEIEDINDMLKRYDVEFKFPDESEKSQKTLDQEVSG